MTRQMPTTLISEKTGVMLRVLVFFTKDGKTIAQDLEIHPKYRNMCFVETPDEDVEFSIHVESYLQQRPSNTCIYPYIFGNSLNAKLLPDNPQYYVSHAGRTGLICNGSMDIASWVGENNDNPKILLTKDKTYSVGLATGANADHNSIALYVFNEKQQEGYITKGSNVGTRGYNPELSAGLGKQSGMNYREVNFNHDGLAGVGFFIGFKPKSNSHKEADATTLYDNTFIGIPRKF